MSGIVLEGTLTGLWLRSSEHCKLSALHGKYVGVILIVRHGK